MFERRQIFNIVFDDDGTRTIYKVYRLLFPRSLHLAKKSSGPAELVVQCQFMQLKLHHFPLLSLTLITNRQEKLALNTLFRELHI